MSDWLRFAPTRYPVLSDQLYICCGQCSEKLVQQLHKRTGQHQCRKQTASWTRRCRYIQVCHCLCRAWCWHTCWSTASPWTRHTNPIAKNSSFVNAYLRLESYSVYFCPIKNLAMFHIEVKNVNIIWYSTNTVVFNGFLGLILIISSKDVQLTTFDNGLF